QPARDRTSPVAVDLRDEPARLAAHRRTRERRSPCPPREGDGQPMTPAAPAGHSAANELRPLSTPPESSAGLAILVVAACTAIFVVVAGILAYTIVRYRRTVHEIDREPAQIYGSNQIEIAWTVIPTLVVIVLTMATARVITEVQDKQAPDDAVVATVIGHQWWWEIRYPSLGVVTANELHVPVSTHSQPR